MKFKREIATQELCQELWPLLELHYKEISADLDIALEPDFDRYIAIEQAGLLRIYTARTEEDALIGYAIYIVSRNLHYRLSLQAVQDVLFIHPEKRGTGARLILFGDRELKREGVQKVYHHVKLAHDFGPMLERIGYRPIERIFAKRLDLEPLGGVI